MGYDSYEISIFITDDKQIKKLNKNYRNIKKATNVLSFPMNNKENISNLCFNLLGDVVISLQTACKEAIKSNISLEQRVSQLLIHGILHLLGFDHETSILDAKNMKKKSKALLKIIEPNKKLKSF